MKILFDQGPPEPLRRALAAHSVSTAYEMGWGHLSNGDLLRAAEKQFDAFITTDRNLRYQQNLAGRKMVLLVLSTNKLGLHQGWFGRDPHGLAEIKTGSYPKLEIPQ